MLWFRVWWCCNDNQMPLNISPSQCLLHLKGEKTTINQRGAEDAARFCRLSITSGSAFRRLACKIFKNFRQEHDWINFDNGCNKSRQCPFNKSATLPKGKNYRSISQERQQHRRAHGASSLSKHFREIRRGKKNGVYHPLFWDRGQLKEGWTWW